MTNQHPITPPPELVRKWAKECSPYDVPADHIATQAARWGGDQELEACCEWLMAQKWFNNSHIAVIKELRTARRPKPPSLKEQALEELSLISISPESGVRVSALDTIRRALEQLDD